MISLVRERRSLLFTLSPLAYIRSLGFDPFAWQGDVITSDHKRKAINGYGKVNDTEKGMFLVNHCLRIIKEANPAWWVMENPARGELRKVIGEPVAEYQPAVRKPMDEGYCAVGTL